MHSSRPTLAADCGNVDLVTGLDGNTYLKFADYSALSTYCDMLGIEPRVHCVGGFENGVQVGDCAADHAARVSDPATRAKIDRLDVMLAARHADKDRRFVPVHAGSLFQIYDRERQTCINHGRRFQAVTARADVDRLNSAIPSEVP